MEEQRVSVENGKKKGIDPQLIQTMKNEEGGDTEFPAREIAINILDSEKFVDDKEDED